MTGNVVVLAMTYVRMKTERGDWFGETIPRYRRALFDFAAHLPKPAVNEPRRIRRHHVQAWLDVPEHSAAYRRTRLSAVRGFCRWMHSEQVIGLDPTIGVSIPDIPESAPRAFMDEDVDTLFETARRDPREFLCVSLCWNDGLRRSEVAKALVDDINWRTATMDVRGKFYRGKVSRRIALAPETMQALDRYLHGEPARTGPLIRSRVKPGAAIGPHAIGKIIGDCIVDAGLKRFPWDGRSSHAGRHTGATQALEAGVPPEIIKRQYGWQNDAMLNRYAKGAALDLHVVHVKRAERRDLVKGAP